MSPCLHRTVTVVCRPTSVRLLPPPHTPVRTACRGRALLGLQLHREAVAAFELGLEAAPQLAELKAGLTQAQGCLLAALTEGERLGAALGVHCGGGGGNFASGSAVQCEVACWAPPRVPISAEEQRSVITTPPCAHHRAGAGKLLQRAALPAPASLDRLCQAPHAERLRRAAAQQLAGGGGGHPMPSQLLAPAQALQDSGLQEAYTYARVQVRVMLAGAAG